MLVFIHGMCNIPEAWDHVIKYFDKKGFSCKAIDLRKGLDLRKTSFKDYVEKVKNQINEEDILIGHSLGGLIIQKVAEEKKIKAGIAICSAPPKGIKYKINPIQSISAIKYLPNIILNKPFKPDYPLAKKLLLAGIDPKEEEIARIEYKKLGEDSAIVAKELLFSKIKIDEKKVKCPFLFIASIKDKGIPPESVKKMAIKYKAQYQEYNCCHHFFLNKNWEDVAQGLYSFIKSLN